MSVAQGIPSDGWLSEQPPGNYFAGGGLVAIVGIHGDVSWGFRKRIGGRDHFYTLAFSKTPNAIALKLEAAKKVAAELREVVGRRKLTRDEIDEIVTGILEAEEMAKTKRIPDIFEVHSGGRKLRAHCKTPSCAAQGVHHDLHTSGEMPPDAAIRKVEIHGWKIQRNGSWLCPDCYRKKKGDHTKPAVAPNPAPQQPEPQNVMRAEPKPPTDQARKAKREALHFLEEAFEGGRYVTGFSDATIAKEVGLSEAEIARIRDEYFGPIRPPSEIEQIRDELKRLAARVDALAAKGAA